MIPIFFITIISAGVWATISFRDPITPTSTVSSPSSQQKRNTEIRDNGIKTFLGRTVEAKGFNCGRVIVAHDADEDQFGKVYLVACSAGGSLGTTYRVTIQPRGTALVRLW